MNDYVIGIDIGTGSTKGILADTRGTVVAETRRMHDTSFPKPGYAEHDADDIWWADVISICQEFAGRLDGHPLAGLTISGIGPVFLPADEHGRPLRPAILYGVDTRSAREILDLSDRLGRDSILQTCGNNLTSQSTGPKVLWLRRNEPDIWARTKMYFMAHTYCVYHLTGAYVLDHLAASMCDPLYSPFTHDWVPGWLEQIAPGLQMPELKWSNEVAGHLTADAATLTGLPEGTPVAVGSVDAFVEALSVGVSEPGQCMLMYGSTMVAVNISDRAMIGPDLWSCSGLLEGTTNLSGGMSTTGSLTTWVGDLIGGGYAELTEEAANALPGSNGLICLPYFSGERSPIADPDARGLLCGLTLTHGRAEIYRSALEATGYGSRHLLETMRDAGCDARTYVAVGGGTTGGLWPQIMSDIIGITQQIPKVTIGAAYGDALLAAMATDHADTATRWNEIDREVAPNPGNQELYDECFLIYRGLYSATANYMHALANLQV